VHSSITCPTPRRRPALARTIVATLITTAGLVAAPVVSTGSPNTPVRPAVTERAVSASGPTVEGEFDLAAVVLPDGTEVSEVEVRVRGDRGWSGWQILDVVTEDDGPDRGTEEHRRARRATEPVLAADSSAIEVKVPTGVQAKVVLVDGGAQGEAPKQSASAAPGIVARADWGADDSLMNCTPTRVAGYRGAVVHHTVNVNTYTQTQAPALVRSIYAYHTRTLGWCDVGYQFLVDRFGTVYEGRSGSLTAAVIGSQSGGFNEETFGVSIIGEFSHEPPSTASLNAVRSVIEWQFALDGIDPTGHSDFTSAGNGKYPAGSVVRLPNIMGHRDNGQTLCPGDQLYALLPSFRSPLTGPPIVPDPRVERHAGKDRYATSAAVSAGAFSGPVPVAYIGSGVTFPDALSAAPVAASQGGPLLITTPTSIPAAIEEELTRLRPARIVVLGGPGAVSEEVAEASKAFTSGPVTRVGGTDRFETSALVSAEAFGPRVPVAFVATGTNFPDALSAGPAAATLGGPILLTMPNAIPEVITSELRRLQPARIVVLGAAGAVSDGVMEALGGLTTGEVSRLAGESRYETSASTSAGAFPEGVPVAYIATGRNFPDALSGAPAAGILNGPLLITHPYELSAVVAEELERLQPARIVILGSHPTVSNRVQLALDQFLQPTG